MAENTSKFVRATLRRWLPFKERKTRRARDEAFQIIAEQATKNKHRDFYASSTILNIALYFLIAERDIQSLKIDALTHPDEWTRKLCARVIVLTIYELDLTKVSGLALKQAMDVGQVTPDVRSTAISGLRKIRTIQRKVRQKFTVLRNTAIAHRDIDALAQYQAINEMSIDEVFEIAGEFYSAVKVFIEVLPEILVQVSTTPSLLRQWMETNDVRKTPSVKK